MGKILILDDDDRILKLIGEYLRMRGFDVVTCLEVEAAEALLDRGTFELIITDLCVSERGGLEGMRLVRHASSQFPGLPILVITGDTSSSVEPMARQMGAFGVLRKPMKMAELGDLVASRMRPDPAKAGRQHIPALETILKAGSLRTVMQPIVDLKRDNVTFAFEALCRGECAPDLLFDYAARKDRVAELDLHCVRQALADASLLPASARVFINAHPRSLSNAAFTTTLMATAGDARIPLARIVLEITEHQAIVNPTAFAQSLQALRSCGVRIALDDYGTGYANLELVRDLRPDFLKLSGTFCRGLDRDPWTQVVIASTVRMARHLEMPLIVEHVETAEELEVMRTLGVEYAQGYYFGKPGPATDYARAVASA